MEFTQEEQAYIDNLIAEKTKGLFTEDDLQKRVTAEVDRRVETGIQKGLETHKSKWLKEFEETSKLTAEELAEKKLQEKMKDITAKESEIATRANMLDAKDKLAEAGIPKAQYEKFIGMLVTNDSESTLNNVTNFIDTFNETKIQLETEIKTQLSKVPAPKTGDSDKTIDKEKFQNLGYLDKLKLKEENPELFKTLMG